jgi:hypothetical protein
VKKADMTIGQEYWFKRKHPSRKMATGLPGGPTWSWPTITVLARGRLVGFDGTRCVIEQEYKSYSGDRHPLTRPKGERVSVITKLRTWLVTPATIVRPVLPAEREALGLSESR